MEISYMFLMENSKEQHVYTLLDGTLYYVAPQNMSRHLAVWLFSLMSESISRIRQTVRQRKKGLYKWLAFPAEVIWEVTQALIPTPTAAHHNETMEKSKHERGTATVCPANIISQLSEVLPGSQRWVTMKITLTPAYPV